GLESFVEGDRLARDDVFERSSLCAWEDGLVDLHLHGFVDPEDQPAAGTPQGLVGGAGDDVGVRQRVGVQTGGYGTRDVCDVGHQVGADVVGDGAEALEVYEATVRAGSCDY